jgi:hypothetical protein
MQNTNGLDSTFDITLSGESDAYFDTLNCGTFQGVDGDFFTGVTSNIQTQIDGISGSLSSTYVTLATTQTISGAKTFTTNPSCTATATTSNHLIKKGTADGLYGQLATTNTWTQINTFSRGIVPRRNLGDGTDYQISSNAMINRQGGSTNNIGIGISTLEGDNVSAGYFYNTGSRNTAVGHFALQKLDGGNDNVSIGYQALQNAGGQRIYGAGITPNRCVAIGAGSQKTNLYGSDNISIGYNSLSNVGSGNSNIILGSNVGGGLTNAGSCVVIGTGAMPTAVDNGIVAIGLNALGFAVGQCNRGVFIGESAGQNNSNGNANTFLGGNSGTANTTGSQNICIGTFAGRLSSSTSNYMVCIGYDSKAVQSNEFVLGGESFAERAELTLPNKTRLACNQSPTGATINLSFRSNENVQLTDATTTTINLPSPTSNANIGTKFYINRQVAGVSININAPAGQTLRLNQLNGTSIILSPYIMKAGMTNLTLLCIGSTAGGTNWLVLLPSIANGADELYLSTVIPLPTLEYSIPFGGLTTTDYQPMFMDNADLKFQPSTGTLTTNNLNLTNKVNIQNIQSFGSVANVSLSFGTNENVLISSTTTTSITLPTPTASNIGSTFNIYKTYTGTSIITVIAPSTQHILADGISSTTYNFGYNQTYLVVSCIADTGVITWTARGNNLFLARNDSSTITGTYTFSTNPIFNNNSIPTSAISGLSTGFVDTTTNQSIGGTKTFTSAIVVPDTSIPTSKIIGYGTTQQIVTNSSNVNYPVTFTTLSTGGTLNPVYGNANMTYNPSTSILTTPNIVANNLYIGGSTIYSPYESKLINSNGNMSVPLAGLYYWTGAGSNNINLPTMTADMVGARVVFCRTGTNVLTTLTINRSGTDVIYPSASGTTSNTIVLLQTSSPNIWRGEIMALSLGFWAVR